MPIKVMQRYTREDLRAHPGWYFVFGDNWKRQGLGGQAAAARGEPNAVGVCTKKAPTYNEDDFLTDMEYCDNVTQIFNDLERVFFSLHSGGTVVWPADGIGTGIADLPNRAPETLKFINNLVDSLKAVYGVTFFEKEQA